MKWFWLVILAAVGLGYLVFSGQAHRLLSFSPCDTPISYRVGTVDPQFKLSPEEFTSDTAKGAAIWGNAYGKPLFVADAKASLSVNLVFDERQSLSNKIVDLESELKQKKADINPKLSDYQKRGADFKTRLAGLNSRIDYWNSQGGAPPEEYDKLISEQESLKTEADQLNALARELNQNANLYNLEVSRLNQTIQNFNTELHYRPEEGLYDGKLQKITIYFNFTQEELIHTLAHEFGHALGLEHIQNPEAMMFSQTNNKINLSDQDITALKTVCRQRLIFEPYLQRLKDAKIFGQIPGL